MTLHGHNTKDPYHLLSCYSLACKKMQGTQRFMLLIKNENKSERSILGQNLRFKCLFSLASEKMQGTQMFMLLLENENKSQGSILGQNLRFKCLFRPHVSAGQMEGCVAPLTVLKYFPKFFPNFGNWVHIPSTNQWQENMPQRVRVGARALFHPINAQTTAR